ncbi:MAG: HD domain-containing phosphohydrolase [Clostridiales bacterium]
MRLVAIDELRGNDIISCDILDSNDRILLTKGSRIKLSYLNKLESLGIYQIYIEDSISEGIKYEKLLCEETKIEVKKTINTEMNKYLKCKDFDIDEIKNVSKIILNEILSNPIDLINLKDIRLKHDLLFSHSISVCSLAIYLCLKMGLKHSKILAIGTGCILHDFGKLMVPKEILYKSEPLTKSEVIEYKKHPTYGYEAVKNESSINTVTKLVIYMHHEMNNGSGYPNGIMEDKIHEAAKICSICDKFDSLTNNLSYRKAFGTSYAVEYLTSTSGIYFDKLFIDEFLKYIPVYPTGSIVLLNNGIVGIVVKNNTKHLTRPIIRYIYNPKTKIKYKNKTVNLLEELTLFIESEVNFSREEYDNISKTE